MQGWSRVLIASATLSVRLYSSSVRTVSTFVLGNNKRSYIFCLAVTRLSISRLDKPLALNCRSSSPQGESDPILGNKRYAIGPRIVQQSLQHRAGTLQAADIFVVSLCILARVVKEVLYDNFN